jgi:phosphate starvation-inducible PhoH-like protein
MAVKKNRTTEEKEFNDVMSNDSESSKSKDEINRILNREVKVIAKNDSQRELIQSIKNNQITLVSGRAGSGKTFCAVAMALNLLKKRENKYKKIYLVKSVTPLKGEELGYIKGTIMDKIEPHMWSFYINIEKIIGEYGLKQLIDTEIVKPFPVAFMRGVTFDNCIIILDEAQNISKDNSLTFLSRIGQDCKIIVLGDTNQIDLKNKEESSLKVILNLFTDTPDFGVIKMNDADENVRNPIINIIEDKFKEYFQSKKFIKNEAE